MRRVVQPTKLQAEQMPRPARLARSPGEHTRFVRGQIQRVPETTPAPIERMPCATEPFPRTDESMTSRA